LAQSTAPASAFALHQLLAPRFLLIAQSQKDLFMQRRRLLQAACVAAVPLGSAPARAQKFPTTKPVTLICPWTPGGSTDAILRVLAEAAGVKLGQKIIVENKGGASGTLGAMQMKNTAPDGYTITQVPPAAFILPHMQSLPLNPVTDLTHIINIGGYTSAMLVPTNSPFTSLTSLIGWAKTNPGKLSWASPGVGSSLHVPVAALFAKLGIDAVHVAYKGSNESIPAIIGGQVMMGMDSGAYVPHVQSGRLRMLAVPTSTRLKRFPAVPTFSESGYAVVGDGPYGLCGPKGMPGDTIKALHDAFYSAMFETKVQETYDKFDTRVWYMRTSEYAAYAKKRFDADRELVQKLNLRASS
jgi:tripartite-type tricarboxylate transporter receptor subunit TctC